MAGHVTYITRVLNMHVYHAGRDQCTAAGEIEGGGRGAFGTVGRGDRENDSERFALSVDNERIHTGALKKEGNTQGAVTRLFTSWPPSSYRRWPHASPS